MNYKNDYNVDPLFDPLGHYSRTMHHALLQLNKNKKEKTTFWIMPDKDL